MTEEKWNHGSDKDLLDLLERWTQEGTAELFHRYGGLVWSMAGKYLREAKSGKGRISIDFRPCFL